MSDSLLGFGLVVGDAGPADPRAAVALGDGGEGGDETAGRGPPGVGGPLAGRPVGDDDEPVALCLCGHDDLSATAGRSPRFSGPGAPGGAPVRDENTALYFTS